MAEQEFDVVVVGGGPAGENAADRAHRGGLTVAVVEERLVGGECSFFACVPSKALLRPGQAVAAARRLPGARAAVTGTLDADQVFAWRDYWTSRGDDASGVAWLDSVPITLLRGRGRLAGERLVQVTDPDGGSTTVRARHAVVVAVGTVPAIPPITGLAAAHPLTNRDITTTSTLPEHLLVLGGGVVACEMAQAFRSLGSAVTMVERSPGLLGRLPEWAGELVADGLRADGVDVRLGTAVTAVAREDGRVTLTLGGGTTVTGTEVLAALGRRPATADLGLEVLGLDPGGYLPTDDTLRVTAVEQGWLYAVGDANGRALLTHMGKYQARVCGDVIAARAAGHPLDDLRFHDIASTDAVPQVVFTDPQVSAVGLTEPAARARGMDVDVVTYDLGAVTGAGLLAEGYRGKAELVVDRSRRVVVGATFVGSDVAELVHSATVAVVGQVPLDRLWHAVPSFPSVSEVWLRLLESYGL